MHIRLFPLTFHERNETLTFIYISEGDLNTELWQGFKFPQGLTTYIYRNAKFQIAQ